MSQTEEDSIVAAQLEEIEHLRHLVSELERQLAEQTARTASVVAAAQERAYWLDRWHVDLNQLMARPGGQRVRAAIRSVRGPVRAVRMLFRRLKRR